MIKSLLTICFFLFLFSKSYSQNLEGLSGLLYIPTAEMMNDGNLSVGINYLPKEYVSFGSYKYASYSPFITLTYLPFFEISFRITRLINYEGNSQAIGDRTISTKVQIFKEDPVLPSAVIGFHDILSAFGGVTAIHNSALYIVLSKNFFTINRKFNILLNAGYGLDLIKAQHHNFVGVFGGISIGLLNFFEIMNEYDSRWFNTGVRIKFLNNFSFTAGFMRYKYFAGGASINITL